jgi:uncharacterized membrane protein
MNWTDSLISISPFIMIIFVVWFVSLVRRAQERHRAELQKDLMAKFTSAQEVSEFMKTEAGKLLMPTPERRRTSASRAGTGTFIVVVGFALLASSMLMPEAEVHNGLQVAGLLAIGAGIGFLISAVVTQKLSRKWGEEESRTSP